MNMLHTITSTGDELFRGININELSNDLGRIFKIEGFIEFFAIFG